MKYEHEYRKDTGINSVHAEEHREKTIAEIITAEHELMQLRICLQRWNQQTEWKSDLC